MQRSMQLVQLMPSPPCTIGYGSQYGIGKCKIILISNKKFSDGQLFSYKKDYPFVLGVTQDQDKKIIIEINDTHHYCGVISSILNNFNEIDHLIGKLSIINPVTSKQILIDSLDVLRQGESYIKNKYVFFNLHDEIITASDRVKGNDIDTILSFAVGDKLQSLMSRLYQSEQHICTSLKFYSEKMRSVHEGDVAYVFYNAMHNLFLEEEIRKNRSKSQFHLLEKNIHNFIESCSDSATVIESILSEWMEKEKIAEILAVTANIKNNYTNINFHHWLFKEILVFLKNNKLLSMEVLDVLLITIKKGNYTSDNATKLIQQLSKLKPLLNVDLSKIVTAGVVANHSCDRRLRGSGLEEVNKTESQLRWAYCSQYAIEWAEKQFAAGSSLANVMQYLASFRQQIAINEEVDYKENFGALRDKNNGDRFAESSSQGGATAPEIFPDLVDVLQANFCSLPENKKISLGFFNDIRAQEIDLLIDKASWHHSFNSVKKCAEFIKGRPHQELIISEKFHGVSLPQRTIQYFPDFDAQIKTNFSVLSKTQQDELLDALDQHCVLPLRSNALSQEEKLLLIGELAYYLSVLYPYKRGSAGIALWVLNGLCQEQFGVTVGQINMGEHNNIPFDVYAHLTTDVNHYKAEFARKITEKLLASYSKKLSLS